MHDVHLSIHMPHVVPYWACIIFLPCWTVGKEITEEFTEFTSQTYVGNANFCACSNHTQHGEGRPVTAIEYGVIKINQV